MSDNQEVSSIAGVAWFIVPVCLVFAACMSVAMYALNTHGIVAYPLAFVALFVSLAFNEVWADYLTAKGHDAHHDDPPGGENDA